MLRNKISTRLLAVFLFIASSQSHAQFFWRKDKDSAALPHTREFLLKRSADFVEQNLYTYRLNEIRRKSVSEIAQMNRQTLSDLKTLRPNEFVKAGKVILSLAEIKKIQASAASHPVVGTRAKAIYDPTGDWGFCWGLNFYVHRLAVTMGVRPEVIKKIWAIGPLKAGSKYWNYHAATIFFTENGWMAADTLFSEPLSVDDWADHMSRENPDGKLRFYITDAEKFWPQAGSYSLQSFGLDPSLPMTGYTAYYRDLFASMGFAADSTKPFEDLLPKPSCSQVLLRK